MKTKKTFDCVELKNAIQARHRVENEGLTAEEIPAKIRQRLERSEDAVAKKWRALRSSEHGRTDAP